MGARNSTARILTTISVSAWIFAAGCKPGQPQYTVPLSSSTEAVNDSGAICEPLNPPASPTPTPSPSPTPGPGNGGIFGLAQQFGGQGFHAMDATLTPSPTPLPLCRPQQAVLSFEGSITNFGIQSVNSQPFLTLNVTNIGISDATQVVTDPISAPFQFHGGAYPGLGGTCSTTIPARGTCTLVVEYDPIQIVQSLSNLNIHYFDSVASQILSTPLTGMGAAYPTLTFLDSSPYNFGSLMVNTSTQHVFTVLYSGIHPATGLTTSALGGGFSFTGGAYPGTGGTCGSEISANCTIAVTFAPTAAGPAAQVIILDYNNGAFAAESSIQVVGTGTQIPTPALTLQITPVPTGGSNYGNRLIGSSTTLLFNVTNTGTLPASGVTAASFFTAGFSFEGGSYPGTSGSCGATITNICLISVVFAPEQTGTFQDQVALSYSNGEGVTHQASLALSGMGVIAPLLQLSGNDPVDFGTRSLGLLTSQTLTVSNNSSVLPISAISFSGIAAPFSITSNTCGTTLAPSATCQLTLAFQPTSAVASQNLVNIQYYDGFHPQATSRQLIGTGTDAAYLVFDPASQSYGPVVIGTTSSILFTVHYYGGQPATDINWQNLAGPDFFYDGGTCSTIIYEDCTVAMKFLPSAAKYYSETISQFYFDGYVNQTASVALSGTGVTPALIAINLPSPYGFGTVAVGETVSTNVVLTNTGGVAATSLSLSGLSSPFSITSGSGCGTALAAGASCTVPVAFLPLAAGLFDETLQVNYQNGITSAQIGLEITGTGSSTPVLGWGGGGPNTQTYSFGNVVVGNSKSATFTLQYYGLNAATVVGLTQLSGPDFTYSNGTCNTQTVTGTCSFGITFTPSTTGLRNATFELDYNNGTTTTSLIINLNGTGLAPALLSFSAPQYAFVDAPLNYTPEVTVQVTNSASAGVPAQISGVGTVPAPFSLIAGTCLSLASGANHSLAPGASCTIEATFTPTASGPFSTGLNVSYSNGVSAQQATSRISGNGIQNALLTFASTAYSFANTVVGNTGSGQINLKYYGAASATILTATADAPFVLVNGPAGICGGTVSGNCSFALQFQPTLAQNYSGNLNITYNDGEGNQKSMALPLSGKGLSPAMLAVSPAATDFGSVQTGANQTLSFAISYSGGTPATQVSVPALPAPYSIVSNTCQATVSGACAIQVQFQPTAAGPFAQDLVINYSDGHANQQIQASLTGQGIQTGVLAISGANFPNTKVGTVSTQAYTVRNTGTADATQLAVNGPTGGQFLSLTASSCGATLVAGSSCSITLQFSPTQAGMQTSQISVAYATGVAPATASLSFSAPGTTSVQLATRGDHSCQITTLGAVQCWGRNNYGQLGGGTVNLGSNVYAVSLGTGYFHSCAILNTGAVKCWGWNDAGQLGLGDTATRGLLPAEMGDALPTVSLGTGHTAKAITGGYDHTCVILDDNSVKCWGDNAMGQLGLGDSMNRGDQPNEMGDALPTVSLGTGRTAVMIAANAGQTCAILDDRSLKCWGDNFYGQLGQDSFTNVGDQPGEMGDGLPPIQLGTGRTATQVTTGGGFTCALLDNGTTKCWGLNYNGTLGACWALDVNGNIGSCFDAPYTNYTRGYGLAPGQMGDELPFVDLGSGAKEQQVASGTFFSCALLLNGSLKCWGDNTYGQMGPGNTVASEGTQPNQMGDNLPTVNLGVSTPIRSISSGNEHSCAVFQDDTVLCWGDNTYGQLDF